MGGARLGIQHIILVIKPVVTANPKTFTHAHTQCSLQHYCNTIELYGVYRYSVKHFEISKTTEMHDLLYRSTVVVLKPYSFFTQATAY